MTREQARALWKRTGEVVNVRDVAFVWDDYGNPLGVYATDYGPATLCMPAALLGYSDDELEDEGDE